MLSSTLAAVATAAVIQYPAFTRDRGPVEAVIDKGLMVEFIVRCRPGTGIMSYSKAERRYCSSRHSCHATFAAAWKATCR